MTQGFCVFFGLGSDGGCGEDAGFMAVFVCKSE